ncbi:HEAT repeat domain-containing protein [Chloracidobacterium validum]|uniref:HEAT repeat domain-containing protein n=1 Tax=Chloracidobacterium validum TaxID=2821543 RepID=A0ABX8BCU8_9BACT|nr:HEAT repeat domain-containing protein [Chloracidobacterium validum]QUW02910.1 HEAT repeat domain-containing protein [Chloracidobacterium validum]
MAAPTNPLLSAMVRPEAQSRGLCPALAMYLSCVNCPFVAACPYKTRLGDFGQEAAAHEQHERDRARQLMAVLLDEQAGDAQRQAVADEVVGWLESDVGLAAQVRGELAIALGDYGDARAFEPLVATLGDLRLSENQSTLREDAALALGELNDTRARLPLIQSLSDWRPGVRFACAAALGKLGDPEAIPALQSARQVRIGDDFGQLNEQVHEMCLYALALLGDADAREPLERLLTAERRVALSRAEIVFALGELGNCASLPTLEALYADDIGEGLRSYTAVALGRLGRDVRDTLFALLTAVDEGLAFEAARALAALGDEAAIEPLVLRGLTSRQGYVRRLSVAALLPFAHRPTVRAALEAYIDHEPVATLRERTARMAAKALH